MINDLRLDLENVIGTVSMTELTTMAIGTEIVTMTDATVTVTVLVTVIGIEIVTAAQTATAIVTEQVIGLEIARLIGNAASVVSEVIVIETGTVVKAAIAGPIGLNIVINLVVSQILLLVALQSSHHFLSEKNVM